MNNARLGDPAPKGGVDPALLRAEVMLDRLHASPGVIDGRDGQNFADALAIYAKMRHIKPVGGLDKTVWSALAAQSQPETWSSAVLRPGALFLVGDPKQAIYRFRGADAGSYALAKSVISKSPNGCLLAVTANFRSRPEIIAHVNRVFRDVLEKAGQPGFVPLAPTSNCRRCPSQRP